MIAVRRIEPSDEQLAVPIAAIVNRAFAPATLELWTTLFDRVSVQSVAEYIAAGEMVVAERDGALVGCVRYRDLDVDTGHFGLLATDPDSAGSGVGRTLVDTVEALAAAGGHRWMELHLLVPAVTTPRQSRLQDWYARRGYLEIDREDFLLEDHALDGAMRWPCALVRERKRLGAETVRNDNRPEGAT